MGARIPGAPLDLPILHMLCTDSDNKKDFFFDWIYDVFKIFSLVTSYSLIRFPFLVLPDLCTAFLWSTLLKLKYIYRPQRSWGKVMFLQASVILLTGAGGWCLPQCMLGYTPLSRHPPRSRHVPQADTPQSRHSPREQTTPRSRHPPPGAGAPPQSRPPRADMPPQE